MNPNPQKKPYGYVREVLRVAREGLRHVPLSTVFTLCILLPLRLARVALAGIAQPDSGILTARLLLGLAYTALAIVCLYTQVHLFLHTYSLATEPNAGTGARYRAAWRSAWRRLGRIAHTVWETVLPTLALLVAFHFAIDAHYHWLASAEALVMTLLKLATVWPLCALCLEGRKGISASRRAARLLRGSKEFHWGLVLIALCIALLNAGATVLVYALHAPIWRFVCTVAQMAVFLSLYALWTLLVVADYVLRRKRQESTEYFLLEHRQGKAKQECQNLSK